MLLDWFSRKHIDEFADSIVAELLQRFPQSGADLSSEKSVEKAMKTLDRIFSRISAFAVERRPNLYQKACFGNRIKWGLKEAGYPAPFVELVTQKFLAYMAIASAARPSARS
ncbi:MAG: hypothetical protein E6H57_16800 [Betaproteobacteria bacterium]|nr:MAG: hypothetical protein E6H57_16800 [Betaproteobacteria bacterium]